VPKEISIEIIRKCPNLCLHCSSSSDEKCTEQLDYDHFVSIINDAKKLGAEKICLSGGEPFLHNRIVDMVNFVYSLDMEINVYTSGISLDENNQKVPLNIHILEIISKKITKLIFNLEAAKSDTYDEIMGTTGCFEIMKQSINNANNFSIRTEAHFVPMKLNVEETEEVIALCKELKISELSFLRLVLQGRALHNESKINMSDEELTEYTKQIKQIKQKNEMDKMKGKSEFDIRIGVPLTDDLSCHKCRAATDKLNIRYDGYVFPCEVFKNSIISHELNKTSPESIYDKSLQEIYRNSAYLQFVRDLSLSNYFSVDCFEICVGQHLIKKRNNMASEFL